MENNQPASNVQTNADTDMSKTLDAVRGIIETVTKAVNGAAPAVTPAAAPVATPAEPVVDDVATEKAADKKRAWAESQLKSAGLEGDDLAKAMANYDKAFPPFGGAPKGDKPVAKGMDAPDAEVTATMEALVSAVEKAKRFTPKREETLKAIAEQLTTLIKEMGMEETPHCASPATKTPADATLGASGIPVSKQLEDLLGEVRGALGAFQETSKSLESRVQKIEETRAAPQSAAVNEVAAPVETKKSLWTGVL